MPSLFSVHLDTFFFCYNKTRLGYDLSFYGDKAEVYKNTLKNSHFG